MKHSKIILVLAAWFGYAAVTGLYASVVEFGLKGPLTDFHMIYSSLVSTICSVGLLMHKKWAMWIYIYQLPISLSLNFWWVNTISPERYYAVVVVSLLLIELVPAFLMWIRRGRLTSGLLGVSNA